MRWILWVGKVFVWWTTAGIFILGLSRNLDSYVLYRSGDRDSEDCSGGREVSYRNIKTNLNLLIPRTGVAIEGFSKLAENEDFQPQWQDYFPDPSAIENFLLLEPSLTEIIEKYPEKRAELRPLSDLLKKMKKLVV